MSLTLIISKAHRVNSRYFKHNESTFHVGCFVLNFTAKWFLPSISHYIDKEVKAVKAMLIVKSQS